MEEKTSNNSVKNVKPNLLQKITDAVPDREEQFELVGLGVRLFLLTWATLMLSLSYLNQGITAAEMKEILGSSQIVRIEHAPLKIITEKKD